MRWTLAIATVVTAVAAALIGSASEPTHRPVPDGAPPFSLPPRDCLDGPVGCAELIEMPPRGYGYVDQRLVHELSYETSTSYVRRDLAMLVRYAAAKVARDAGHWQTGNGGSVVLADMSESDGSTPGTRVGRIRHPPHTHEDGFDIDIAYYQRETTDNGLRAVCRHREDGVDAYHCLGPARHLDAWRTALLVSAFLESPRVRVIGMDARVAQRVINVLSLLCSQHLVDAGACGRMNRLAYESHDTHKGWFISHHNHLHVSLLPFSLGPH